jgi:hypothetical protein
MINIWKTPIYFSCWRTLATWTNEFTTFLHIVLMNATLPMTMFNTKLVTQKL